MFYVQHRADLQGSHILWWRPKRRGHTYCLDDAGIYNEDQATRIAKAHPGDLAWNIEDIEPLANRCLEVSALERSSISPALDAPAPKNIPTVCPRCKECGRIFSIKDPHEGSLCWVCR